MYPAKLKAVILAKLITGVWTGATDETDTPVLTVNGRIMPMEPIAEYFGIHYTQHTPVNNEDINKEEHTDEDLDTVYSSTNTPHAAGRGSKSHS